MADAVDNELRNPASYNDQYNFADQYSMVLFRPDQAISQRDLNEEESSWNDQFRLFGNKIFKNGTIMSGMNFTNLGSQNGNANNNTTTNGTPNLLDLSDASAVNSVINTDGWLTNGNIDIVPESEKAQDYPGIEMNLSQVLSGNITVSFGIQKVSGNLKTIGFGWTGDIQQTDLTIDNIPVDNNSYTAVNDGQQIPDINDGSMHVVTSVFNVPKTEDAQIYIVANNGLDVTQAENTVHYTLSSLMVNKGAVAKPWTASNNSNVLPKQGQRNDLIHVSSGTIWLDGRMRLFDNDDHGQDIKIIGQGKEYIGVRLNKQIITPNNGNGLYDTTTGAVDQWGRLADRIHYNIELTYDDPKAITIYTLMDGKIVTGNGSTGNARLDALLAARTYDQSGSFRVSGFDFDTSQDAQNSQFMANLNIDAGIAYVMGYAVYKLQPTTLHIPISNKEETQSHEPLSFEPKDVESNPASGVVSEMTSEPLGAQPVDQDSVHVYGPLDISGVHYSGVLSNQMTVSSEPEGLDQMPPIFQSQHGAGGGVLGDVLAHFGTSDNSYEYTFKYDFKTQNTYVKINQGTWSDYQVTPNNYDINYHGKSNGTIILSGIDGMVPQEENGIWYLSWGGSALDILNHIFENQGTDSGDAAGRTYFVDGLVNYAYKGPEDVSGDEDPDYYIVSDQDSDSVNSGPNQGVPVSVPHQALNNARIRFGGDGTTHLMPPNPYANEPYTTSVENHVWVDYKYYDATVGILTLDQNGNFNVVMGKPAAKGTARPPEQISPKVLQLGYIILSPDDWHSNCEFSAVTRIPFSGLQDLVTRISNLESIVQNNMLNVRAKANVDPTGIQNILCDDFTTLTTADLTFQQPYDWQTANSEIEKNAGTLQSSASLTYNAINASVSTEQSNIAKSAEFSVADSVGAKYGNNSSVASQLRSASDSYIESSTSSIVSSVSASVSSASVSTSNSIQSAKISQEESADYYGFNVAYDLSTGTIAPNDDKQTIRAIRPNAHQDSQCHVFDHTLTASFDREVVQEEQNHVNNAINVNNDSRNTSSNGLLNIYPNADDFINCNNYEFSGSHNDANNIQLHNWFTYNNGLFQRTNPNTHLQDSYSQGQGFSTQGLNDWSLMKESGLQTASAGREFTEPREIEFSTQWLAPNSQNYYILINNTIPVSARESSSELSFSGSPKTLTYNNHKIQVSTVNADGNGQASGLFTLPDNLTTGVIKVSLVNSDVVGQPSQSEVSNTYYANGIKNDDIATVTHQYNATDQYNEVSNPPIAQTIRIRKDSVLTSLDLFFINKPAGDPTPSSNLLVQLRKVDENGNPSDVVLAQTTVKAENINSGTVPTSIEFDDPIYAHAGDTIALTLLTNSGEYVLAMDTQNHYPQGKLLTSDGSNWTQIPGGSLEFILNRASFNTNTEITFDPDKITKPVSKVALLADYITPDNTSLKWSLSVNDEEPFPINRRRQITYITDQMTNSNNISHDSEGNPTYNTVKSLQLFCTLNESPSSDTNDELIPGNSRVSPIISLDTVALSVSASNNSTNIHSDPNHLDINTSYTSKREVSNIYKAMENADGLYMTRALWLPGDGYNTVTTTFDAHEDDHCKVIPIYSFSNGEVWGDEPNQSNGKESHYPGWLFYSTWNTDPNTGKTTDPLYVNYPKVIPVNSKFNRYTYKVQVPGTNRNAGDSPSNFPKTFQMGLLLYSDSPYHQPMVRRLSNILTIEDGSTQDVRPFTSNKDTSNYIDIKNDENNPSDPFDWNTSNNFGDDYNANY